MLQDAPVAAYVYRLFSFDALLYVGCSVDPESRLSAHRHKPWGGDIHRMTVDGPYPMSTARAEERYAISAERPLHNVQLRNCQVARPRPLPDWCYMSPNLRKRYGVDS